MKTMKMKFIFFILASFVVHAEHPTDREIRETSTRIRELAKTDSEAAFKILQSVIAVDQTNLSNPGIGSNKAEMEITGKRLKTYMNLLTELFPANIRSPQHQEDLFSLTKEDEQKIMEEWNLKNQELENSAKRILKEKEKEIQELKQITDKAEEEKNIIQEREKILLNQKEQIESQLNEITKIYSKDKVASEQKIAKLSNEMEDIINQLSTASKELSAMKEKEEEIDKRLQAAESSTEEKNQLIESLYGVTIEIQESKILLEEKEKNLIKKTEELETLLKAQTERSDEEKKNYEQYITNVRNEITDLRDRISIVVDEVYHAKNQKEESDIRLQEAEKGKKEITEDMESIQEKLKQLKEEASSSDNQVKVLNLQKERDIILDLAAEKINKAEQKSKNIQEEMMLLKEKNEELTRENKKYIPKLEFNPHFLKGNPQTDLLKDQPQKTSKMSKDLLKVQPQKTSKMSNLKFNSHLLKN